MAEPPKTFEQQEKARLAKVIPPRKITTCQDETFHPEPYLVALEPVSNFILRERQAPTRTAAAWPAAMTEALAGLPVQVIQSTAMRGRRFGATSNRPWGRPIRRLCSTCSRSG